MYKVTKSKVAHSQQRESNLRPLDD